MARPRFLPLAAALALLTFIQPSTKYPLQDTDESSSRKKTKHDVFGNNTNAKEHMTLRHRHDMETTSLDESPESTPTPPQYDVPIYLSDPSTGQISSMEWNLLSSQWDRQTTFSHLLQSINNPLLPTTTTNTSIPFLPNKKIITIFHLSPKSGSSTLRKACLETQYDTCHKPRKGPNMKWPDGYLSPRALVKLMHECTSTHHYCVKHQPLILNYTTMYDTSTFLHVFPFRQYDEWVASALKQIHFRDGDDGCNEAEELLDRCQPHKYELDFGKYGKSYLAYFIHSLRMVRKSRKNRGTVNAHHHILLYDYTTLDGTMQGLNRLYGVPLLKGTDEKENSVRPGGTCGGEMRMLDKFHDCFSDALLEVR